ncbi:MAG: ATP-dependent Clp protease ATP-binding subunit [Clostridiales bacterium]|jgi:ATP-dependent Clp protease ATP-binding subunit ClpC|nr:ATP-dependent Clp protease ATP-binding subunit [Clostridiales bacterium]
MNIKEILKTANNYANNMGHEQIGTVHLLLAVLTANGVATNLMSEHGIVPEMVIERIDALIGIRPPAKDCTTPLTMSPRAKHAIQEAANFAKRGNSPKVGTHHLLLSLICDSSSLATEICMQLGIDIETVCEQIVDFCNQQAAAQVAESHTPFLDQFSCDISAKARRGELDKITARDDEIIQLAHTLRRRTKNNPCLIGEPGVGKSAIVAGFAQACADGEVPPELQDLRILEIDIANMVAGTKYRGEFEERIKKCIEEAMNDSNIVLFIDEIHILTGAGASADSTSAANILKPCMARGEVKLIGATTFEEYRRHIEKDAALARRFQPITVNEPDEDSTVLMLMGVRERFEAHHNVRIPKATIQAAVDLAAKYVNEGFMPDKAIDLLDCACTNRAFSGAEVHRVVADMRRLESEIEKAIANKQFTKCEKLNMRLNELRAHEENDESMQKMDRVLPTDVVEVVAKKLGVEPKDIVIENKKDGRALLNLESELRKHIIGQDSAIETVSGAVRRGRAGLRDANRPVGSFLFLGASGVGKTALAKELANVLYPRKEGLVRVDMSELMEASAVSKLIGAAPGYVGYNDTNRLTEHVRKNPHCVVIFDEIEKAHKDVLNILLQVLEEGMVTDSAGRQIKFNNTIVIMTSNIGGEAIASAGHQMGFADGDKNNEIQRTIANDVIKKARQELSVEFLGRIDDIVVFNQLRYEDLVLIAGNMLSELAERAEKNSGIKVTFPVSVAEQMAELAAKENAGARPLRRIIQTHVEDELAEKILSGVLNSGENFDSDNINESSELTTV